MTSPPLHPTRNAVSIFHSSSRWRPANNSQLSSTNTAQTSIPIYTAAPHNTTLSYTFSKNQISKIFWALFRGPRGFCPPFSNSPTPLHNLKFFPTFLPHFSWSYSGAPDVSTYFHTSFFTAVPKGLNTQGTKSNTP